MTKPSRPTALVALLLACALLSAGFVSHAHDEGHAGGDDHHCAICCLRHHSPVTTTTAPRAPAARPGGPPRRIELPAEPLRFDVRHPPDARATRVTLSPSHQRPGRSPGIGAGLARARRARRALVLLDEHARTELAAYLHPNDDPRVGAHVLNVMDADCQETAASPTLDRLVSVSPTLTPLQGSAPQNGAGS